MNNKHLSSNKEINNNFIIASRAYFLHKHPGAPRKPNSTAATFCNREIPSRGLFRSSTGGGIDQGGPLHQLHGLFGDVCVVYFRPSSA